MKARWSIAVVLPVLFASLSGTAQVSTGQPWQGSFTGGPDVINLGNLNVNWTFPLINKPGRGIPFVFAPTLDSSIWYPVTSNGVKTWQYKSQFGWSGLPGGSSSSLTYSVTTIGPTSCGPTNNPPYQFTITQYQNYVYTDSQGTAHTFPSSVYTSTVSGNCYGGSLPYTPVTSATGSDGTGWTIHAVPGAGTVTNSSGIGVVPGAGLPAIQEDIYGNYISCSSTACTDTLNTQELSISGSAAAPPVTLTVPSITKPYKINYQNYTVQTAFNCSGIGEFGPTTESLISSIVLPDGTEYKFTYEPTTPGSNNVTGRLLNITIPTDLTTGPTIAYAYSGGDSGSGIYCADGSTPTLTRTTPDGTWTYARSGSGTAWTTTTTAPPGSDTKQDQNLIAFYESGGNFYEIGRQIYSGSTTSGTLLETILTCHQNSLSSCPTSYSAAVTGGGTGFTTSEKIVTNQFPDNNGISAGYSEIYNVDAEVANHTTYDFGSPGSGQFSANPLQIHQTSYLSVPFNTDSITGASVGVDRVQTDYIVNGYATPYQTLTFTQNNFAQTATSASGASHRSNGICATGTTCQFDITSTNKWISGGNPIINGLSGTNYQTIAYVNYDTGLHKTVTDVNLGQTTYTYGGCAGAFPTLVSTQTGSLSLSTSGTWNCSGGVPLTSVDMNGNTTTFNYGNSTDQFWRPTSITNNATGAVANLTYPTSSTNTSSSTMTFYGGSSVASTTTTYDSLGRPVLQQTLQSPGWADFDTVAIAYDARGRAKSKTLPYTGAVNQNVPSNPGTTTSYDALDRPVQVSDSGGGTVGYSYPANDVIVTVGPAASGENAKRRSLEFNGAGWLTSVCEITAGTSLWPGGSCAQSTSNTGYLTKYSYNSAGWLQSVKQNAQGANIQTRGLTYDGLGRKLSDTIPEWSAGTGAPGTRTYTYDSTSSGCSGSYPGDLVKTTDNAGNVTCYTYDLLHRVLSSKVVSGTYADPITPQSHFVYDAASYSSTPMQNAAGNIAEAYTCTGSCSSKITDEFFSMSPVASGSMAGGVTQQIWESTPNSGGYFLTSDTRYPNGALGGRTSAYANSTSFGYPKMSYGLDGEGRPFWASDGTRCINPVTATSYNAAGSPTNISFGNASTGAGNDLDTFQYDANTNRPTAIQYSVNASNGSFEVFNALTWNANGSLNQMISTDTSDSSKNQTCNYTADDLGRIASANCGSSTWAQNFSYDPFGNITKTGSGGATSYGAGYNAATNQVSSGITQFAGYDANGNQLNSTALASISWNANGQAVSVSSLSAGPYAGTYDALGRLVETTIPGASAEQFVYGPSGAKIGVVQGATLVMGLVPLPGGARAIYNGTSGMPYIRHTDWLGSSRLASTWAHGVYAKESYAPFGEVYNEAGTPDRSFTGQDQDIVTGSPATGTYEFMFRKYDPSAGRWLSPDPAGWGAVDQAIPQSLNRYTYVYNNPLRFVDPSGLKPIPCPDSGTLGGNSGAGSDNDGMYVINACDDGEPVGADPGPPSDCSLNPQCNADYNAAQLLLLPSSPTPSDGISPLIEIPFKWIIDKMAEEGTHMNKSLKYVEKLIECETNILRDNTENLKNVINHGQTSVNAGTDFSTCMQEGVIDPMTNPIQSF